MDGICLESLISGIISSKDILLVNENTNIVSYNEKPIYLADKYNIHINCSEPKRFSTVTNFNILNGISDISSPENN